MHIHRKEGIPDESVCPSFCTLTAIFIKRAAGED